MKFSTLSAFVAVIVSAGVDTQAATVSSSLVIPTIANNNTGIVPSPTVVFSSGGGTNTAPSGTVTGTSYPTMPYPACIVLVNGTGTVVPINATATTFIVGSTFIGNNTAHPTATVSAGFSGNAPGHTHHSGDIASTITASRRTAIDPSPTTATAQVNASAATGGAPTPTIIGTVYTTAPGQVTTLYASSYIGSFPSDLPICSDLASSAAVPVPSPTNNASSLADTAGGSPKSGASPKAVGITAAMLSVGASLVALVL